MLFSAKTSPIKEIGKDMDHKGKPTTANFINQYNF